MALKCEGKESKTIQGCQTMSVQAEDLGQAVGINSISPLPLVLCCDHTTKFLANGMQTRKYVQILSIIKGRWFAHFWHFSFMLPGMITQRLPQDFFDYEKRINYYLLNSLLLGMGGC